MLNCPSYRTNVFRNRNKKMAKICSSNGLFANFSNNISGKRSRVASKPAFNSLGHQIDPVLYSIFVNEENILSQNQNIHLNIHHECQSDQINLLEKATIFCIHHPSFFLLPFSILPKTIK